MSKGIRRGFNLIEAAIVLGVIGLVIGGIWVAASAVQLNFGISDFQKSVLRLKQEAENLNTFGADNMLLGNLVGSDSILEAKIIPLSIGGSTGIPSSFAAPFESSLAGSKLTDNSVQLGFTFVPRNRAFCTRATRFLKVFFSQPLANNMSINYTSWGTENATGSNWHLMNDSALASLCEGNDGSLTLSIGYFAR